MSTEPPSQDVTERLLEQACGWLSKLHGGEFSSAEQQQLAAWRETDSAHEQAWQRAQVIWQGLEQLRGRVIPGSASLPVEIDRQVQMRPDRILPPSRRRAASSASFFRPGSKQVVIGRQIGRPNSARRFGVAMACSALLVAGLAALYPPLLWQADYLTGTGQQSSITLADGSRLILNTASAVAIRFDDSVRRVELLKGEAFFEVAKNPQRPFVVTAAGSEVRAVGTAFDVRRQDAQTQVELVEGVVDVRNTQGLTSQRLQAGQIALIADSDITVQVARSPQDLAMWREGYLQFDGLPLHEAVAQINRYRPGRVVLLNSSLADKRVSGLFRLDALDQAILSLQAAVPQLQTVSITPYLVVLR